MPGLLRRRRLPPAIKHHRVLMDEKWNGNAISTGRWTVTDTTAKLTVEGGQLKCAGGTP